MNKSVRPNITLNVAKNDGDGNMKNKNSDVNSDVL